LSGRVRMPIANDFMYLFLQLENSEDGWSLWRNGKMGGSVYIKMLKIQQRFDDNFLATGPV